MNWEMLAAIGHSRPFLSEFLLLFISPLKFESRQKNAGSQRSTLSLCSGAI